MPIREHNQYIASEHLTMIVGNYGSGKTEVAVNLAIRHSEAGKQVTIADLDIVNPYFRCREAQVLMRAHGIRVVIPPGAQQYADLPIVVPEIKGMLEAEASEDKVSLFDVGGDDVGATMLSSFAQILESRPYSLFQVINSKRPFTDSVDGCLKMKTAIERASRLKVTGFIVNSHLIEETTTEVIIEGYNLAREVSCRTGLPIEFVTAMGKLAEAEEILSLDANIFKIERIMLPPWLQLGPKEDRSSSEGKDMPAGRTKPIFVP